MTGSEPGSKTAVAKPGEVSCCVSATAFVGVLGGLGLGVDGE